MHVDLQLLKGILKNDLIVTGMDSTDSVIGIYIFNRFGSQWRTLAQHLLENEFDLVICKFWEYALLCLLVWVDALDPSQQFFCNV